MQGSGKYTHSANPKLGNLIVVVAIYCLYYGSAWNLRVGDMGLNLEPRVREALYIPSPKAYSLNREDSQKVGERQSCYSHFTEGVLKHIKMK